MEIRNKTWLCGLTYGPAIEAVKKNIVPIAKHFDGLNIVLQLPAIDIDTNDITIDNQPVIKKEVVVGLTKLGANRQNKVCLAIEFANRLL